MPCRQRPLEQYSHISSTRSYSPPPHRPVVLPSMHGICFTVYPSHPAAVSDYQPLTHPPNREKDRGLTSSWGCLAIPPPSISPTPVGPQTSSSSSSSSSSSMSCLAISARPVRCLSFQVRQAPFPATICRVQYRARALVACSLAWDGAGISGSILCGGQGGGRIPDVKACERSGGTVPCGMPSRPESGRVPERAGLEVAG